MPFSLPLPDMFRDWTVKIQDKETGREEPHATFQRRGRRYRISLRTGDFLDEDPPQTDIPEELVGLVRDQQNLERLRDEWRRIYPNFPI